MLRLEESWLDDLGHLFKVEALWRAQADVRATPGRADSCYWAAFQLVGAR
jgi:CHAT domain-containing protein